MPSISPLVVELEFSMSAPTPRRVKRTASKVSLSVLFLHYVNEWDKSMEEIQGMCHGSWHETMVQMPFTETSNIPLPLWQRSDYWWQFDILTSQDFPSDGF